ncbi:MAG TPA: hypothetical protein VNJ28_04175 [Candidatus Limnocylindrales bacterium]|jgi:hypothetical protein|nr:hypothetical protein [Candidatus Limnocylindrales bacterium]
MAESRNDLLGELAADAALERRDFLVAATDQLRRFLEANRERIAELGGLTLIDDDPDYLSIAPDLTFRSRTRYFDEATGQWVSDTEVIESPAELVELYNPADVFQAFAEAAREAAGLGEEPTAAPGLLETAGVAPEETIPPDGRDLYAAAADEWAAGQGLGEVTDREVAAQRLYDLALTFQERSQEAEARLFEQFEEAAARLAPLLGDIVVVDDEDERLLFEASGSFRAEVLAEGEEEWRALTSPEELVEFYDPTDVFGDLADAIAEAYPGVAPEIDEDDEDDEPEDEDEEEVGPAEGEDRR